jgi:hypothetical protein
VLSSKRLGTAGRTNGHDMNSHGLPVESRWRRCIRGRWLEPHHRPTLDRVDLAPEGSPNGHLVQFRMSMRPMLADDLADMARRRGDPEEIAEWEAGARAAKAATLYLQRDVYLPGIPQVGEEVIAHTSWNPVRVTRREWMLDPEGDEAHVTVYLDELDDDEVGQGSGELLLDLGWVRRAES